jgi:hypothetical protein
VSIQKKSVIAKMKNNKAPASLAFQENLGVGVQASAPAEAQRLSLKAYERQAARKRNRSWFAFWFY